MKHCPKCGHYQVDDFCVKCGTPVQQKAVQAPRKKAGTIWTVIAVLVVAAVGIGFGVNASNEAAAKTAAFAAAAKATQDAAAAQAKKDAAARAAADAAAAQAAAQAAAEAEAAIPTASTVTGAVVGALEAYCPNTNQSQWNTNEWHISNPVNPPSGGYWQVWANSYAGILPLNVAPNADNSQVTITAGSSDSQQAFAHWGCPGSMKVNVYNPDLTGKNSFD